MKDTIFATAQKHRNTLIIIGLSVAMAIVGYITAYAITRPDEQNQTLGYSAQQSLPSVVDAVVPSSPDLIEIAASGHIRWVNTLESQVEIEINPVTNYYELPNVVILDPLDNISIHNLYPGEYSYSYTIDAQDYSGTIVVY